MKTLRTIRVCLTALAVAGLALTGVANAPAHAADARPVMPLNGWNGRMGPGIGSTKSPFNIVEVGRPLGRRSDDRTYFHTITGQAVQQTPNARQGPGPGSSKSPHSSPFNNGPR